MPFVDRRVRMRNALRALLDESRDTWEQWTPGVLRNRLLDETGSDARPLAELLMEARRRGWRARMPATASDTARWDAAVAPFILQWSAERFIQPEMARWAVECWGYALGIVDATQLRIAPPPPLAPLRIREPLSAFATRLNAAAGATGVHAALTRSGTSAAASPSRGARVGVGRAVGAASRTRASNGGASALPSASYTGAAPPLYRKSAFGKTAGRSLPSPLNPWIARSMLGFLAAMFLMLIGTVMFRSRQPQLAASPAPVIDTVKSLAPVAAAEVEALVPANLTGGVRVVAPPNPGVTGVTRSLLPTSADSQQLLYVQPARRASGESRRAAPPPVITSPTVAYDEVHLVDGTTMRGRVEVMRASTVLFRDVRTGLRHELSKETIGEIITEYGSTVRFRRGASTPAVGRAEESRLAIASADRRTRGTGGSYLVRYGAATAVGSRECSSVWTRPPNAVDRASVRHVPGADTLTVTFERGDSFPSIVDADGFFSSTPRIVGDQARTSTALVTRIEGQFRDAGVLDLTVQIVFYRRLRSGDLACNVTVRAAGQREE